MFAPYQVSIHISLNMYVPLRLQTKQVHVILNLYTLSIPMIFCPCPHISPRHLHILCISVAYTEQGWSHFKFERGSRRFFSVLACLFRFVLNGNLRRNVIRHADPGDIILLLKNLLIITKN